MLFSLNLVSEKVFAENYARWYDRSVDLSAIHPTAQPALKAILHYQKRRPRQYQVSGDWNEEYSYDLPSSTIVFTIDNADSASLQALLMPSIAKVLSQEMAEFEIQKVEVIKSGTQDMFVFRTTGCSAAPFVPKKFHEYKPQVSFAWSIESEQKNTLLNSRSYRIMPKICLALRDKTGNEILLFDQFLIESLRPSVFCANLSSEEYRHISTQAWLQDVTKRILRELAPAQQVFDTRRAQRNCVKTPPQPRRPPLDNPVIQIR